MMPFDPATIDIDALLKRLHLANARRCWRQLTEQAASEQWSPRDFFAILLAEEIAHRQGTRLRTAVRDAEFPFLKTIEDFDFAFQSALRPTLLGQYLGHDFVTEGRNLILMGKTGRGKTHLAIAIAYRAIQNGFTARFISAAVLIDELSAASRTGQLREALARYHQPHVLVVDEVGYLTYGPDAANVLFHVVNDRHLKKRPMVFTTNKSPLTAWGSVLHDHDLAEAIVDRTLERGRLLVLDGPSYRTRHLPALDLPDSKSNDDHTTKPDRVSGKNRTEFPEPTTAPADLSKKRLAGILKYPGPLSTLAARAQVAFLCRLIGRNLHDAIEALREIRNSVAHGPDEFVLGNHRDEMQRIYNLGPGMPLWINRMACELIGRSFLDRAAEIKLPNSDKPFFATPADVLKYIDGKPNLLAPLNERLPRCELAIGIIFICALLIDSREAALRVCGASETWPRFRTAPPNKSVEPTRPGLDD